MYKVTLSSTARRVYERTDQKTAARLDQCFMVLQENPFDFKRRDIKKLKGELQGLLRLRKGDFRIVYRVDTKSKLVEVIAISTRGHSYR